MIKGKIDVISLGCSKNLIDSELLMGKLNAAGYRFEHNPDDVSGEWVVVNTCGFISDAKEESIEMLLQLGQLKSNGTIGKIVVMGCLSQRYMDELKELLPEVDIWYGKFDWRGFLETLPIRNTTEKTKSTNERFITTPDYSAYIKVSEGCDRFCAFCAIPIITGRHTSRTIEEIVEEVTRLSQSGTKEFNIIAQDLSSYGKDIYNRNAIAELVDKIADIPGVEWIRLHYAYPADFPDDLLDVMAKRDNVCKYLDIALQHISDNVLSNMRRNINSAQTKALINKMRQNVPGLKLRTTLMVGFPGEGEKEFKELLDFVKETKFERMGAFAYSEEEDTYAAKHFEDMIPEEVKQQRLDKLMQLQEEISLKHNESMIGHKVKVLVDRVENNTIIGRTQWDSPEVDPEVIVDNCDALPGQFIEVEISDAYPYELRGHIVGE